MGRDGFAAMRWVQRQIRAQRHALALGLTVRGVEPLPESRGKPALVSKGGEVSVRLADHADEPPRGSGDPN